MKTGTCTRASTLLLTTIAAMTFVSATFAGTNSVIPRERIQPILPTTADWNGLDVVMAEARRLHALVTSMLAARRTLIAASFQAAVPTIVLYHPARAV